MTATCSWKKHWHQQLASYKKMDNWSRPIVRNKYDWWASTASSNNKPGIQPYRLLHRQTQPPVALGTPIPIASWYPRGSVFTSGL